MPIVVQKYGGSSVADLPRIDALAAAVVARAAAGAQLIVVVSAMGKATDQLIAQARQLAPDPSRRELDMLVSCGERSTMALLSIAIQRRGQAAISLTGSQSGIITDEQHQAARIVGVRPQRVLTALAAGQVVIVAGYQGVSRSREITTLGRGGSDLTAVALAAATGAEACEIYSDVDGVYSADPAICPQARLLPSLDYELMQGIAGAGARVLSVEAVAFASRAGIVIEARRSGEVGGPHSRISVDAPPPQGPVAVVGAGAVSLLRGPIARLPEAFWDELRAVGGRLMAAHDGVALVERSSVPGGAPEPVAAVAVAAGLTAEAMATVSVLGGALLRLWPTGPWAAAMADVPVSALLAQERCITLAVPAAAQAPLVRALHAALLEAN